MSASSQKFSVRALQRQFLLRALCAGVFQAGGDGCGERGRADDFAAAKERLESFRVALGGMLGKPNSADEAKEI